MTRWERGRSLIPTVGTNTKPKPRFKVERVAADMALRGWNDTQLAQAAGLSARTVGRFLSGQQTAKTAERIATALGYSIKRYFSHVEAA